MAKTKLNQIYVQYMCTITLPCPAIDLNTLGLMRSNTKQNYKHNTFVFAPIFHKQNSKI